MRVAVASLGVLAFATYAHAERRAAVANLAPGDSAASAVESVRKQLDASGFLPPERGEDREALEQPLPSAERPDLDAARRSLAAAQAAYEEFDSKTALARLDEVDGTLGVWAHDAECRRILADRRVLAGLVQDGRRAKARAEIEFRLAHRLDPDRTSLDESTYPPAVVAAYARAVAANEATSASSAVALAGAPETVRVDVDGRPLAEDGSIPLGPHWVTLSSPGHAAKARLVVAKDASTKLSVDLAALPGKARLADLRQAAIDDPDRLTGLAAEIASVAAVDRVVFVRSGRRGIEAAHYDAADRSLSAWNKVGGSPRAETQVVAAPPSLDFSTQSRVERDDGPWYREWWGAGLLAAGAGAAVTGVLYFALRGGDGDSETYAVDQWCVGECP